MCILCCNSQWRSVMIGLMASSISFALFLLTFVYRASLEEHMLKRLRREDCVSGWQEEAEEVSINWTQSWQAEKNECIFLVFWAVFPWPLWVALLSYSVLNSTLVVSAIYSHLCGVTMYLALDAVYVGLLAAALCLSFFPSGVARVSLLTLLFPLFALALCAWMTVFGFYLKLEGRASRECKRRDAVVALEDQWRRDHGQLSTAGREEAFTNFAFAG